MLPNLFALALGCFALERLVPGWQLPQVRTWPFADPKNFNHKETGYVLEGKHAGLACNKCHLPEKIPAADRSKIKMKDLSRTFLGIPTPA